jgi:chromosome segregation ATPase
MSLFFLCNQGETPHSADGQTVPQAGPGPKASPPAGSQNEGRYLAAISDLQRQVNTLLAQQAHRENAQQAQSELVAALMKEIESLRKRLTQQERTEITDQPRPIMTAAEHDAFPGGRW